MICEITFRRPSYSEPATSGKNKGREEERGHEEKIQARGDERKGG